MINVCDDHFMHWVNVFAAMFSSRVCNLLFCKMFVFAVDCCQIPFLFENKTWDDIVRPPRCLSIHRPSNVVWSILHIINICVLYSAWRGSCGQMLWAGVTPQNHRIDRPTAYSTTYTLRQTHHLKWSHLPSLACSVVDIWYSKWFPPPSMICHK